MLTLWWSIAWADPQGIVGGQLAAPGAWPDVAAIGLRDQRNNITCTGVLVAPDVVLTAGHCVVSNLSHVIVDSVDYEDTSQGELIGIREVIEYPNSQRTYDAAILVLDRASTVPPRLIATECVFGESLYTGAPAAIAGFGAHDTRGTAYDSLLREAFTTITDPDCTQVNRGCISSISPGGEIGAGGGGVDTCFGDSGGPLYLDTPLGWMLVGLTSRGWDDTTVNCAQGGIYVRADALLPWIESETGRALARAGCGANLAPAPTVPPIVATPGQVVRRIVSPNGPDGWQSHEFLVFQPAFGSVTSDGTGAIVYTAAPRYVGPDGFVVRVTDNGDPRLSAEVGVWVEVRAAEDDVDTAPVGSCGCDAPATGPTWTLLPALWLVRRRRSGAPPTTG